MPELELSGGELGPHGLRVARQRLADAFLYELDARALPFRGEFDVVCAFDVLEHIDEDVAVMEEMRLAGKPGALILLSVPQHRRLWSAADDYAGHKRRYSRSELLGKLASAGLAPELVTSFASAVLPLMVASRIRTRLARSTYDPTMEHRQAERTDALLSRLMSIDLRLIRAGRSLPAGGSLFVAARAAA
jgi:SAM-dependent methyltransferase